MSAFIKPRLRLSQMVNEPRSIVLAAIGLAGAAMFSLAAAWRSLDHAQGLDSAARGYLAAIPIPFLPEIANATTWMSDPAASTVEAALLATVLYRREGGWAWVAPVFFAVTVLIELGFKVVLAGQLSSFPSGHVARIVFLGIVAGAVPGGFALRLAFALVAVLTIFTRVSIGVHPLTDVVGGLGLGAATGSVALLCLHVRERRCSVAIAIGTSEPGRSGS